ncbi:MAG TPA: gliding motility-associated C-terminal domain-containing protein, partial [Chryseolinea sp.]|nr:gliding motility-associated C-terminal domain-containing protein [Chryseolinea sp.]
KSLPQKFSSSYMCKTLDGKYFLAANFYYKAEVDGHSFEASPDSNILGNAPNIVVLEFDLAGNIVGFQQFKPHIINLVTSISAGLFNDLYISGYSDAPTLQVGNIQMTSPNDTENNADGFIVKFSDQSIGYESFDIVASNLCTKESGTFAVTANVADIKNISWDFGDPTSGTLNSSIALSPSHSYNTAGVYKTRATITDFSNKLNIATIIFEVHEPPSISLGNDFGLCLGEKKRIEVPSNAEWTCVWQDGSIEYFNDIKQGGKYWVSVNDQNCTARDTVSVTELNITEFKLNDHTLCPGEEYVIDLSHLNASINWNDGSVTKKRNISNAGNYVATAVNSCGSYSQSIIVTAIPILNTALEDGVICKGHSFRVDLGEIDATISWNDGDTAHVKNFDRAGSYSVKISNQCEQKSESFIVSETAPLNVDLGKDKVTCNSSELTTFSAAQNGVNYLWSNGSTESSITVHEAGVYWVDVTNSCETVSDSVAVVYIDQAEIFIPNIITPNGDTRNDVFTIDERIKGSSFLVFNRWGQNVYSTDSYNNDWRADNLEAGVYFYTIPEYCLKGWIHVLRE